MINNINNLKDEVQKMNFEHYLSGLLSVRHKQETVDMPIRVLDSIIQFEESGQNGFSVYNRGENLKKSLIDASRVKAFIVQQEKETARSRLLGNGGVKKTRSKANERLKTVCTTKNDPDWANMMEFFKNNPSALMNALPTPPGSEDGGSPKKSTAMDTTL